MNARLARRAGLVVGLALLALLLAFAAEAFLRVDRPTTSSCVGRALPMNPHYRAFVGRPGDFRVTVLNPADARVWDKRGPMTRTSPHWDFTPSQTGRFRSVYRWNGSTVAEFDTLVARCAGPLTVRLNDRGRAMLRLANAKPGDADASCVVVVYTGTRPASMRLYGGTRGAGLDRYLDLKVVRGRLSTIAFDSCKSFEPDRTNYIGAGKGVVYLGTLASFPDRARAGRIDPTPQLREIWTTGESHAYKFVVALRDDNRAQGRKSSQSFTWEAKPSRSE